MIVKTKIRPVIREDIATMRAYCGRFMLTPSSIGREMGVSGQYVSAALRGQRPLSDKQVARLWEVLVAVRAKEEGCA